MEDILKESGEARKLAVALSHVEYGGGLVEQLFTHSTHMEKVYGSLQSLVSQSDPSNTKLNRLTNVAKERMAWFVKAKAWCFEKNMFKMDIVKN